jgi:hypothetical protein
MFRILRLARNDKVVSIIYVTFDYAMLTRSLVFLNSMFLECHDIQESLCFPFRAGDLAFRVNDVNVVPSWMVYAYGEQAAYAEYADCRYLAKGNGY